MPHRTICVLTGTRAEYGLLRPVMDAIATHPELTLQVLVTGMHLAEEFGLSVREIEADGYPIMARVPMHPQRDTGMAMALAVGEGVQGISKALDILKPSFLLLLGDRTEVLAGAVAALYMNIPIAHIHGGDITRGGIDESVRHAVTKMAHLHFPATAKSGARVLQLGEDLWRIYIAGAPGLDTILRFDPLSRAELAEQFGVPAEGPYIVLVQHAVSTEPEEARAQIQATFEALEALSIPTVAIYPNSDAGGRAIVSEIELRKDLSWLRIHPSLAHRDYLSLIQHCAVLVGNSSSGVIESASFKIPVVNIGIRQEGRERGENVVDVPHSAPAILEAIKDALLPETKARLADIQNPYGGGDTGQRIAEVLARIEMGKDLIQKKLTYT